MGTFNTTGNGDPADGSVLPAKNGLGLILTNPKERGRFIRFAIVGAMGAVVDFGVFNLLVSLSAIPAVWASVVSFVCAVVSNFLWNRYWTYPDARGKKMSQQLIQFVIVSLIGLAIRTPLFAYLEVALIRLGQQTLPPGFFLTPTFVGHNVALAIAIFVIMMWNFFVNRFWTYNDVR